MSMRCHLGWHDWLYGIEGRKRVSQNTRRCDRCDRQMRRKTKWVWSPLLICMVKKVEWYEDKVYA